MEIYRKSNDFMSEAVFGFTTMSFVWLLVLFHRMGLWMQTIREMWNKTNKISINFRVVFVRRLSRRPLRSLLKNTTPAWPWISTQISVFVKKSLLFQPNRFVTKLLGKCHKNTINKKSCENSAIGAAQKNV